MRDFQVVEIFCSPQGEGAHMGQQSVFVRFSGCNLGGGAGHRHVSDVCQFCDTEFSESVTLSFEDIVAGIASESGCRKEDMTFPIILTGGEPLLQVDTEFVKALHEEYPEASIHVETNGTVQPELQGVLLANPEWFWVAVSPKLGSEVVWRVASEVKVVVPGVLRGTGWSWGALEALRQRLDALEYWLMPQDAVDGSGPWPSMEQYLPCLEQGWRFGVQGHKVWQLK